MFGIDRACLETGESRQAYCARAVDAHDEFWASPIETAERIPEQPFERLGSKGRITLTLTEQGWRKVARVAHANGQASLSGGLRLVLLGSFERTPPGTVDEFEARVLRVLPQDGFAGIAKAIGLGEAWGRHSRALARELRRMRAEGKLGF